MYNCIIIGAGNMGALKPDNIDAPGSTNILTHAHAIDNNKDLKLAAIIERDPLKAERASLKWRDALSSISTDDILHYYNDTKPEIDIVTIATPTNTHYEIAREVIEKIKPKMIICEKPFCNSLEEASCISELCNVNNIKLLVHYNRRYCYLLKIMRSIYNEDYGQVISCVHTYKRGIKLTGCHSIDAFNCMFGACIKAKILEGKTFDDYSIDDLTYPVHLEYLKCPNVFMVPHHGECFSMFDFRILTTECEIFITNHGELVYINPAEQENIYGNNFKSLFYNGDKKECFPTGMKNSLVNLYVEAVNYLDNPKDDFNFSSTAENALEVHRVFKILGV